MVSGHYGADNDTDWFKIRGFDQATYQDGLRIYREGFYQWLPETYGLERVELLRLLHSRHLIEGSNRSLVIFTR